MRRVLQVAGVLSIAAFTYFVWQARTAKESQSVAMGEEVYASHDCTDCHLAAHVLRQKRDKKEVGLIRVRKDFDVLQKFLETDQRHQSYVMISEKDRRDLVEYLRTLIVQ